MPMQDGPTTHAQMVAATGRVNLRRAGVSQRAVLVVGIAVVVLLALLGLAGALIR
jgi:hypothetical protein